MNLYLDDNRTDRALAGLLRSRRHGALLPADAGLAGASDVRHLTYAIRQNLVVLTADCDDFEDLHTLVQTAGGEHPGILLIHYDNDPTRDMRPKHIVAAIGKLERSGMDLANQIVVLNHWR